MKTTTKTTSASALYEPVLESEHFTLYALAEGVYAAIATELGAGFSNAGLIDLGDQTMVFDAFEHPKAAEDLLRASIQLTHRKPTTVVISHLHPDHWGGLQVFDGCQILATLATRQAMLPIARGMAIDIHNPSRIERDLRSAEARLTAEIDPLHRKSLQIAIARQGHYLEALPILKPTLPNQTFDGKIVFHGTSRSVELIHMGKGHTESDCILQLLKDRINFIGDIGFFQMQPFMVYGFPREWIALLNNLANRKARIFVPGHGPVGCKVDLRLEAKYIQELEDMVLKVIKRGSPLEEALVQILPPPFDAWQRVGQRFEANVRSSFERQSQLKG